MALALRALLSCPFPAGGSCPLWISQRQLFPVPARTHRPTPAPGGVVGCCHPGCRDRDTGIFLWLAQQVPPYRQPAHAALRTEELLCFSPDVGQPGTEIFNMPAITGAGNSPLYLYRTSSPTGLTATESRRLGRFKHLLFSFCRKTKRSSCWEAEGSGHTVTPCC